MKVAKKNSMVFGRLVDNAASHGIGGSGTDPQVIFAEALLHSCEMWMEETPDKFVFTLKRPAPNGIQARDAVGKRPTARRKSTRD